jgi:hypothetical protein
MVFVCFWMFSGVATKNVATSANEEVICIIEGVQMGDVDVSDELGFDMSRGEDVFLTDDNSIHGNKDDVEEHTCLDYGSFGSPLSNEKVDDYVSSFLLTVDTIFMF